MNFTTRIPIPESGAKIDYNSKIFLAGSCFVENIGAKFEYFQLQHLMNPFGILFHPLAIENLFRRIVENHRYSKEDIFFYNERWHCFEAHSNLSDGDRGQLLQKLNLAISTSRKFIESATHVIITPGTAWGYFHKKENRTVANCHKIPQREFDKKLQSPSAIENSFQKTIELIQAINPKVKFLFTVSPVRHLKDGFVENQRSKAHLITAIHNILENKDLMEARGLYFPSYEIMMDELRDYRFYNEDMLHPSTTAVNYIWQRFTDIHLTPETEPTMNQVDKVRKGLAHRPFNPESEEYRQFLEKLKKELKSLHKRYPYMNF